MNNTQNLKVKPVVHYRLHPNENLNPDAYYFSFFDYPLEKQDDDIITKDFIRRREVSK